MRPSALIEESLTRSVIGAFYEVYNDLRYGLLEHVYVNALERELVAHRHRIDREGAVQVSYKGDVVATQRLDMVVDGKLVVEIKSTADLHKAAVRQLRSYLHATHLEVGLLLHFGPEAQFFRLIHSNARPDRLDPPDQPDPHQRAFSPVRDRRPHLADAAGASP